MNTSNAYNFFEMSHYIRKLDAHDLLTKANKAQFFKLRCILEKYVSYKKWQAHQNGNVLGTQYLRLNIRFYHIETYVENFIILKAQFVMYFHGFFMPKLNFSQSRNQPL